jgi:hypothetical protein
LRVGRLAGYAAGRIQISYAVKQNNYAASI